ncbi:MAG: hypothetical protein HYZ93_05000 [Candidatus Omnitrophica bacterium]|nr:hypothetical protein [Candidatus Omnitrophota bacterium]
MRHSSFVIILSGFFLWFSAAVSAVGAAQAGQGAQPEGPAAAESSAEPLVSVDFRETEIGDILRLLAKQYNLNIIVAEGVKGPISVRLSGVTVDEALDAIVTVNGFAYLRRGRVIRVIPPGAAEQEAPVTQVLQVKHATAKRLAAPLKAVLSANGTIEPDDRSNALVVRDVPSALQTVMQVLQELDVPTPQVLIETKIIETVLSNEERLGVNWNLTASLQGSAQPTTFPIPQKGSLYFKKFRPQGQTSSESTTTTTATGATATATQTDFPGAEQGLTFPFVDKGLFTFGTLSFNQLQIIIQALESRGETKALAVPSITTLDNEEAQIVVGTNVPVPTFARNKNTGEFEITGYVDKKTGVVLKVTPHVTKDQRVLLEIHPQISSIERFVGDPRAQVPVTATREAETMVDLRSGDTAVIGGLIEERDVTNKRSVPYLGKIPFVGRLFRFNETTKSRTDLLIFMTAHILTNEQIAAKTAKAVRQAGRPELFGLDSAKALESSSRKPFKTRTHGLQAAAPRKEDDANGP